MKRNKILTFLLLLSMSFSVVHAYAIEMLDAHESHISEYVLEFSQPTQGDTKDDVCNIHAGFHISFIVPENIIVSQKTNSSERPLSLVKIYKYQSNENLLKPPKI